MYVEFARLEGFSYPEDFMAFVDAIDSRPDSGIAKRYRTMMTDVLGPIQLEVLELVSNNESLLQADDDDSLYELLLDYMLMASSYRLIFARWKAGDFSMHFSHRRFEHISSSIVSSAHFTIDSLLNSLNPCGMNSCKPQYNCIQEINSC